MHDDFSELFLGLNHTDPSVRRSTQQKITANSTGIRILAEAAQRADMDSSLAAIAALTQIDEPARFQHMIDAISARNPLVGETAVSTLESYGENAIEPLLAGLSTCHALVQLNIVRTLGRIGGQSAVFPLMDLLIAATHSSTLRYTIIETLGMIGDPTATETIRLFINDPDFHVRERVYAALDQLRKNKSDLIGMGELRK